MIENISRRKFIGGLGLASVAAGTGLALQTVPVLASGSGPNPDAQHIQARDRGYRVLPTGADDRANIEWALRNTGPGGTVKLVAGTYKMGGAAVVPDFDGRLVGAGTGRTTITCTDEYNYELWEAPGGGRDQGLPKPPPFPRLPIENTLTRTAPGLILFYKTPLQAGEAPQERANRIEIRDLRVRGAMLGEYWAFGDEVLCFSIINSMDWSDVGAEPETTRQDVYLSGVLVDGYKSPEFGVFENGCACITVLGGLVLTDDYDLEGATDGDALGASNGAFLGVNPAEGEVTFRNCKFVNCRLGPGVVGYKDSDILFEGIETDGCRGNCLQLYENSNCRIMVRDCDLFCDSILLPPELTPGGQATDIPSSLGCVVAFQGSVAALGMPSNLRWLQLSVDPAAHAAHPEAGPLGTWRPLGPRFAPEPSSLRVVENSCRSPGTPNSYCLHAIDMCNLAFGLPSLTVDIHRNRCEGSQTCISLEHVNDSRVRRNKCISLGYGVELHNAMANRVERNRYRFVGSGPGCEVRTLALGEKLDFYRVVPGAGSCSPGN